MARKVESSRKAAGGLESLFELAAIGFLAMGMIVALVVVIWLLAVGLLPALTVLLAAALAWLLLRGIAEVIRLLKKLNGLPFDGNISGGQTTVMYRCSKCQSLLHSESRCDGCGEAIED